jgi:hypothetical protein
MIEGSMVNNGFSPKLNMKLIALTRIERRNSKMARTIASGSHPRSKRSAIDPALRRVWG